MSKTSSELTIKMLN